MTPTRPETCSCPPIPSRALLRMPADGGGRLVDRSLPASDLLPAAARRPVPDFAAAQRRGGSPARRDASRWRGDSGVAIEFLSWAADGWALPKSLPDASQVRAPGRGRRGRSSDAEQLAEEELGRPGHDCAATGQRSYLAAFPLSCLVAFPRPHSV